MKQRLAIVGSGIAGLGAAYLLQPYFDVFVFEQDARIGGHVHTVDVPAGESTLPVDTGFMVFNYATYPNLTRLFKLLNVAVQPTDMSFSVQHLQHGLEWRGADWNGIFGQRKNLLNLRFWGMLAQLDRFNKEAIHSLKSGQYQALSLSDYVVEKRYGEDFLNFYLIPMTAAIWSSTPEQVLAFPASALLRFFYNHGFLGRTCQHQWYTVQNGANAYVQKLVQPFQDRLNSRRKVLEVARFDTHVDLKFEDGAAESFDKVILATHADQVLGMLAQPNALETRLLGPFGYQRNPVLLHTDRSVMPKSKHCWASWNYRIEPNAAGEFATSTHYWMNQLQGLPQATQYFVSLNADHFVNPNSVIKQFTYEHPIFNVAALQAQSQLQLLNQQDPSQQVYFCGSYFRYGFHEDAFLSAVNLAKQLAGDGVWP